jgi:serine protease AprX
MVLRREKVILDKIDERLIQKVQTLGSDNVSAIIFFCEDDCEQCKEYLQDMDIQIKYNLPFIKAYAVEIPGTKLETMARSDIVRYISDDTDIESLLNIATQEVGARIANRSGYTGKGVGIAILDTGTYPHPDLTMPRNRIIAFKDFVNKKISAYDDNGHGTFVAGVAAGNGYGSRGEYAGVAPDAEIISIKVMDNKGQGNTSDILAGMQWVVDNHKEFNIRVMSLSLGSETSSIVKNDPLAVAVGEVWKRGIVVVAAAGNSGPRQGTITTPGVNASIITVGAVDDKRTTDISDDEIAEFSSRGPALGGILKPDVVAPGVDVVSLNTDKNYKSGQIPSVLKKKYITLSGTSVSTPIVSGLAALMFEKNPDYTPNQIKKLFMENCHSISNDKYAEGSGIVEIGKIFKI